MAELIEIAKFELDMTGVINEAAAYRKEIDALKNGLKELKKSEDTTTETLVDQESKIKALNEEYKKRLAILQSARDSEQQSISRSEKLTSVLEQQSTTIRELRLNNKELNQLKLDAPIGSKELEDINKKLDENNKALKDNADEYTKQKINIGNYQGAIEKAIPGIGQLTSVLNGVKEGLNQVKNNTQASQQGFTGLIKLSKGLRIALLSTGIGAIAAALGLLVTYLTTTQEGMDKVTKITKPLSVIFQRLLGVVQDLGGALFDAATKPKEALETLRDFITNQIINRFKALSVIVEGLIDLDFTKVSNGLLQVATGVEDVIGKVQNAAQETSKFFDESIRQGQQLANLAIEIEKSENNLLLTRSKANNVIKAQNKIAEDTNKSLKEREIAANNVLKASNDLLIAEQKIIDKKIEQKELENSLNDTSRADQKELIELQARRNEVETQQLELQTTAQNKLNIIRNQAAAESKARADARIAKAAEESAAKIKQAEIELETFRLLNKERLASDKETMQQVYEEELRILGEKAIQEKLTASEINLEKLKLKLEFDEQIKEIDDAKLEAERIEAAAQDEFNFQLRLEKLREQKGIEFEVEREIAARQFELSQSDLQNQLDKELITQQEFNRQAINLSKQKNKALDDIRDAEKQANINAAAQTIDAVASVVDQSSAAGKAISLAKAGFAVFEAISKANAVGFPANIPLIAQAATIGYKAIDDIASVEIPSAKGSGTVSTSNAPSIPQFSTGLQRQSDIENNPTVTNQIGNDNNLSGMTDKIADAVAAGASKGTSQGMIELSDNRKIKNLNTF